MSECPNCKSQKLNTEPACDNCRQLALRVLRDLQPAINDTVRETIRLEIRDRDVVEWKTAQIAATKLVEWTKPFGYVGACLIGLLGFLGIKSSLDVNAMVGQVKTDLEKSHTELAKARTELATIQVLAQQAQADFSNIEIFKRRFAELSTDVADLPNDLRIGTVYNQLVESSTWTTNFEFPVKGAFVVPVDHYENIQGINPIDPKTDIRGKEVTYTIRKKQPDAVVGIRIVAWGFGRSSDNTKEDD